MNKILSLRSISILLIIFSYLTIACSKSSEEELEPEPEVPAGTYDDKLVSTYIRYSFYEIGAISDESLLKNDDLIYLTTGVYEDGSLFFEIPINHGTGQKTSWLNKHDGRNGVVEFSGEGASVDVGSDLLIKGGGASNAFSFSTWLYIDEWTPGSAIFKKLDSGNKKVSLEFGQNNGHLAFYMSDTNENYAITKNAGLTVGKWHHVAVTFKGSNASGNQLKIYIDGEQQEVNYNDATFPTHVPFIRSGLMLGDGFKGKLDETSISLLELSPNEVNYVKDNEILFNNWNFTKMAAYWQYDDGSLPLKDSRTWLGVLEDIQQKIGGLPNKAIRLACAGGAWKEAFKKEEARNRFAEELKAVITNYGIDGVDLDFEWCTSTQEWSDYSLAIIALGNKLGNDCTFSVSLHPLYYKISQQAIDALDYVSIQSYGPSPQRFPYNEFTRNVKEVLDYGFPKEKLIMGLPFFATSSDGSKITTSYGGVVSQHPNLNPASDQEALTVRFQGKDVVKEFTFNGQKTMEKKVKYVLEEDLAGVMSWDVAIDVDYAHEKSLLKAVMSALGRE